MHLLGFKTHLTGETANGHGRLLAEEKREFKCFVRVAQGFDLCLITSKAFLIGVTSKI
jgi:hypothetical protein